MKTAKTMSRALLALVIAIPLIAAVPQLSALPFGAAREGPPGIVRSGTDNTAVFPEQLQIISSEAFSGTSLENVRLNEKLTYIGEQAFEDAASLTDVYVPENTAYIGENAFPAGALIHCTENSIARAWAEENGYRVSLDYVWNDSTGPQLMLLDLLLPILWLVIPADRKRPAFFRRRIEAFVKSMRPQDRPELYCIDYRFP